MADTNSGPLQLVFGIVEGVKGKLKEIIGVVIGRREWVDEGRAQQDKADAHREVAEKEGEAEAARAAAKTAESRQKAKQ